MAEPGMMEIDPPERGSKLCKNEFAKDSAEVTYKSAASLDAVSKTPDDVLNRERSPSMLCITTDDMQFHEDPYLVRGNVDDDDLMPHNEPLSDPSLEFDGAISHLNDLCNSTDPDSERADFSASISKALASVREGIVSRVRRSNVGEQPWLSHQGFAFYSDRHEPEGFGIVSEDEIQNIASKLVTSPALQVGKALLVGVWDYPEGKNDQCTVCCGPLNEMCIDCSAWYSAGNDMTSDLAANDAVGDFSEGRNDVRTSYPTIVDPSPHTCVVDVLACGHREHEHCIQRWLRSGVSSPKCLVCLQPLQVVAKTMRPYSAASLQVTLK